MGAYSIFRLPAVYFADNDVLRVAAELTVFLAGGCFATEAAARAIILGSFVASATFFGRVHYAQTVVGERVARPGRRMSVASVYRYTMSIQWGNARLGRIMRRVCTGKL